MMKNAVMLLLTLIILSFKSFAFDEDCCRAWVIDGALGMAFYSGAVDKDRQSATGRISLGHVLTTQTYWQAAFEAGIQSGNTLSLHFAKEDIDALGGVEIEAELKPILDLLVSLKTETLINFPVFSWIKGGVAYRQFQVDKTAVNNLKDLAPELIAGFGYQINEQAAIHLGYQFIWGQNPQLTVDEVNETATLRHIPVQQSVMLGFSYLL
ncbi:hypothetical protein [Legionella feeleii]|uniref:Outer membrane protein beta-barrel domain-containing protein n=1 Tax=Legionella feeleii TaxID=453 RepID=A0A378J4U1_9GAMM|nr:hypothetical protein [Legionella feeleii]STX39284.1 Uncharacterised protein [Legionella feeleii]